MAQAMRPNIFPAFRYRGPDAALSARDLEGNLWSFGPMTPMPLSSFGPGDA